MNGSKEKSKKAKGCFGGSLKPSKERNYTEVRKTEDGDEVVVFKTEYPGLNSKGFPGYKLKKKLFFT